MVLRVGIRSGLCRLPPPARVAPGGYHRLRKLAVRLRVSAGVGKLFQQGALLSGIEAPELLLEVRTLLLDALDLRLLLRRQLVIELITAGFPASCV